MKHIVLNRGCQSNWVGGEGGYRLSIQGLYVVLFELRLISAKVGQITGTKNILDCSIRIKTYSESLGKIQIEARCNTRSTKVWLSPKNQTNGCKINFISFRGLLTFISCKYIHQADSTATFRIKHGRKLCSGNIVVKIPGDWIKDSHNFQLEKVDLTVVPQVFGKGSLNSIIPLF